MVTLSDYYPIRKASAYANPKQESSLLPVIYGDLRYGSVPIWICPCIDTVSFRYCIADCVIDTDNLTLYDDGVETSSYTISTVGDVTIATFNSVPTGEISARGTGKEVGGVLLQNPADILLDILTTAGYDTVNGIDWYAWNQVTAQLSDAGIVAAGVIMQERTLQELFTEILASVLGSFWMIAEGQLFLMCDLIGQTTYPLHGIISERRIKDVSSKQSFDDLCNQVQVYFAPALVNVDRRYNAGGASDFLGYDDGSATADLVSQAMYGVQTGDPFECRWLYDKNSVNVFQSRVAARFANPVWVLELTELSYQNLHVQQGQYLIYSWRGLRDAELRPLRNQIGKVLSKRVLMNQQAIQWQLVDTGFWLSEPPASLDGTMLLDGSITLGGQRNQEKL